MSFRARLALRISLLVALAGLVGLTALAGLWSLRNHFDAAHDQYAQLRTVYEVGHRVALARTILRSGGVGGRAEAERAIAQAQAMVGEGEWPEPLRSRLDGASLGAGDLDALLGEVARQAGAIQGQIIENRQIAIERLGMTIVVIAALLVLALASGIWIGVKQYRGVMVPLSHLRTGVERLGHGELGHRIERKGDAEFRTLIDQFNSMASELERLRTSMEHEVDRTSRALIRSERLASVGALAAGVAHEINNPLGIIAGYAQSSLRRLDKPNGQRASDDDVRATLRIIDEEAFRCRAITDQLLDLARPTQGDSQTIDLRELVERVAALVRAIPASKGRTIEIDMGEAPMLTTGDRGELLQVVVNILTNALEATAQASGVVTVRGSCEGGLAIISVIDNGCGMTPSELDHAFEPFWSRKRGRDQQGSGLGLAVSHAIVQRHGGRLLARSDGPGMGATFSVELPLAQEAAR